LPYWRSFIEIEIEIAVLAIVHTATLTAEQTRMG
jgi:hypothetical protein